MSGPRYCPFYCEENIWWLASDARVGPGRRRVAIISNMDARVALWSQQAGAPENDGLVVWDYHVVLSCDDRVWDLDTSLGLPVPFEDYLEATFRGGPTAFHPLFRVMEAEEYRAVFASDRRHMRRDDGTLQQPPPPWRCIGEGHTLDVLREMTRTAPGLVVDVAGLRTLMT